ncbi:hypothetical protein [Natronohydrobacter thiooxidans]|jgi:hypothetical protein|uniref:hypothetical protein n=1 Tax=Natronohydrobacter thiooxidans TaxID=87172 RepID=UPI001114C2F6|nr:hypothetical protein [Natronohydrobacter thiooxidans]
MEKKNLEKALDAAIAAANDCLVKHGVEELMVIELGLAEPSHVRDHPTAVQTTSTWKCSCWDCVNTNGGICTCNGPACQQR